MSIPFICPLHNLLCEKLFIQRRQFIIMEEDKERYSENRDDRFARFLFGGPKRGQSRPVDPKPSSHDQSTLDFGALLENIDALMESAQNLKPIFKKTYPFIQQFFKKK